MNSEILITSDGSHTLFVPEIDECYHSTHGAIQESRHIFIETALKQHSKTELNVLEVGFGTGLNALLALVEAERSGKIIHYCTLEKYPVTVEKAFLLNYPAMIDVRYKDVFEKMHSSAWNGKVKITPFFEIEKMECDFTNFEHTSTYDIVFFDAFSPEKQPEMWTQQQFEKIYAHCNPGVILTTYCAKGVVRRALQSAGFSVERLAGPPGKREILRAVKL
ncbi:MAG: tRNA (5-methylaminomethyl-2-thiouridine)(34)-methyltransferase MnmD [Paludibacter sp.]|nr:tRNA (5-methylaminomethyl-2-thiouridine)(34)-methyltransferase MnmD [Paludibacter sp.]